MIHTLSTTPPNTTSNKHSLSSPPSRLRRLTTCISDSKKILFEHLPHHHQNLTNFRKRARSFLTSTLNSHSTGIRSSSSKERASTPAIINVDEIYRCLNPPCSDSLDIPGPSLSEPSKIIDEEQSKLILLELPSRLHGLKWHLIFSTEAHGFSLNQLYRRSCDFEYDSPSLIIVKDIDQNIFGAFSPHRLRISEGVFGTGESFLFTFHPEFRAFNWSGSNDFFVKGDIHSIGFGIGEGTYALWLDADLYRGRSCSTKTYNNSQLTLNEDFIVANVEVWTFVD